MRWLRPGDHISLLSTLGKLLEAVIAERISHVVETYRLLPTNDFGARKWRGNRVLRLISFGVKGAYNGGLEGSQKPSVQSAQPRSW